MNAGSNCRVLKHDELGEKSESTSMQSEFPFYSSHSPLPVTLLTSFVIVARLLNSVRLEVGFS